MRKVNKSEAEKKCQDFGILWAGECSAKDFSDGELIDIFTKYTKEIYNKVGNISSNKNQVTIKCGEHKTQRDCSC